MKLFIANTTKQNHNFRYLVRKDSQVIIEPIQMGHQVMLKQELTREEIDYILSQHKGVTHEYMIEQKELDMSPGFIGLVYAIDKQVSADRIATIIDENDGELDKAAAQMQKDTASVIAANMEKATGKPTEGLTFEVIEEVKPGSGKEGLSTRVEVESDKPPRRRS